MSGEGELGSMSFDLNDDPADHDAGKTLFEAWQAGKLGAGV